MNNKSERRNWELPPEKMGILHLAGNLKGLAESAVAFVGSRLDANSESMMIEDLERDSGWREWREAKKFFWAETSRRGPYVWCHFFGSEFSIAPLGYEPKEKGQIGIRFDDKSEIYISEIILKGHSFIGSLREGFGLRFPRGVDFCKILFPPSLTGLNGDRQIYFKGSGTPEVWQKQLLTQDQIPNLTLAIKEIETTLLPPTPST